MKQAKL